MKNNVSWILFSILLHAAFGAGLLYSTKNLEFPAPSEEILDLTLATAPAHFENKPAVVPATKPALAPQISTENLAPTAATETTTTAANEATSEEGGADSSDGAAPVAWGEVTRLPKVTQEVKASYPAEAKKAGVAGPVVLDVLVDSSGKVRDVKVVSGPGFGLNESAVEALKQFGFRPALKGTTSVAVKIRYTYRFKLDVN